MTPQKRSGPPARAGHGGGRGPNDGGRGRSRGFGGPRRHGDGSRRPPRKMGPVRHMPSRNNGAPRPIIPPPAKGVIRVIPLGGVEEIGRNMTPIEIGNDIIVVDAGFGFGETDTPGIDYILPNTEYLEENRAKIRGLIITHGHLDHIGGIPYIIDRIGNPAIYTRKLTGVMIRKRQEEFAGAPVVIREVEQDEGLKLGQATIRFFGVTHTVPDSMGIIIETQ